MTTHFTAGVTNVKQATTMGGFGTMDPSKYHVWWDDFDDYVAAAWTVTETQGAATQAATSADGGVLLLTNSTADDDVNGLQWAGNSGATIETFKWASTRKMWLKTRLKIDDADRLFIAVGLAITDVEIEGGITDGIYFRSSAAGDSSTIQFVTEKDSTESTGTITSSTADDTYIVLGAYYDAAGTWKVYADDVEVGGGAITSTSNTPDDEELAVTIHTRNGDAAANKLYVDYLMVAQERAADPWS